MSILQIPSITDQFLVWVYKYIDNIELNSVSSMMFKNDKIYAFKNNDLSVFFIKDNKNVYLVFESSYKDLKSFKIKLGNKQKLFNKRVINCLRVKIFKSIGYKKIDEVNLFFYNLFENNLSLVLNEAKEYFTKNISARLFNRVLIKRNSDLFKEINNTVTGSFIIERSFFGQYKIRCWYNYFHWSFLGKIFYIEVNGNGKTIKHKLINSFNETII